MTRGNYPASGALDPYDARRRPLFPTKNNNGPLRCDVTSLIRTHQKDVGGGGGGERRRCSRSSRRRSRCRQRDGIRPKSSACLFYMKSHISRYMLYRRLGMPARPHPLGAGRRVYTYKTVVSLLFQKVTPSFVSLLSGGFTR